MAQSRDLDLKRHRRTVRYRRHHFTRRERRATIISIAVLAVIVIGLVIGLSVLGKPPDRTHEPASTPPTDVRAIDGLDNVGSRHKGPMS